MSGVREPELPPNLIPGSGKKSIFGRKPGESAGKGFTLIEILIGLAVGGLVMSAVMGVFIIQNKSYDLQEQMTRMVQTARAAMDMMAREVRMAGYDPADTGFEGITYNAAVLQLKADLGGDNAGDPPDGDTDDANECIAYRHDPINLQIDRNTGGGNQPFAENIETFSFAYLDKNGHSTTVSDDIRQLRLTITARTAKADPNYPVNGGYRTYTLCSSVTPPNLACP